MHSASQLQANGMRAFRSPYTLGGIVAMFALLVYLRTLAPTVSFIDSGELAAVACTLGIAHPTGYPLFTLLGWIFAQLPLGSEEIVRLNVMAAIFCATGVFFFFLLMHFLLSLLVQRLSSLPKGIRHSEHSVVLAASVGASLLLAFSETYWSQAVAIEVYALHTLFLGLVSYAFIRAAFYDQYSRAREMPLWIDQSKWWWAFAFFLGLSFTNHMTTILLAPGFVFLYFATQGNNRRSWKRIGVMSVPFLVGLSVYLYLPIRAAQVPVLNWGNPTSLERLFWHLSGKQYRVWIFSSMETAGRQLTYFLESLPGEHGFAGLLLAFLGTVVLWRSNIKLGVGILVLFATCVFYSINYDIHDIDSYFLLAYFCVALLAGAGLLKLGLVLVGRIKSPAPVLVMIGLMPLVLHYGSADESENYLVEDYTMNMFNSLQPRALILSFQWDYWLSASYYYQFVKDVRPDVAVVDKELLRRSWYFAELEQRYPWLLDESRTEVDAFLRELYKFERDLPYDPSVIQSRFVEMIRSFVRRSMENRPVYVTAEIEPEFTAGLQAVPEGLAFRLRADKEFYATPRPEYQYRPFGRRGRFEDRIRTLYAASLSARGRYYYLVGNDAEEARISFRKALEYDGGYADALRAIQAIGVE